MKPRKSALELRVDQLLRLRQAGAVDVIIESDGTVQAVWLSPPKDVTTGYNWRRALRPVESDEH